ncbi:GNAT family N-acetyltransferase [Bradymonas sediminis]|uniref:RimJ/RimL family protein N-acetyltransferase n=1 Tax=Bradymonas sediminis TaxID=1548548 RepID=A0A2Z4FJV9_9DELT|nr:GNAT family N-acetyltransferase [Bradymonas sediminis]AWV89233.1 RimJ/RimL family protein N-acetyltransferase [Bradymonas sediminis]TDP73401.1 ribosomal-protein-serine acetyltransferase [Bradymonas sediminis]
MFAFTIDEKIELRLHEEHHAEELFALTDRNRAHLGRWFPWVEHTQNVDDTLKFIKGVRRGYADNEAVLTSVWCDGNIAGTLGISRIDWNIGSGEIGYWLGADYEGRGIITRSCRALISYAFDTLKLNRIVIKCQPENTRSSAVAKRLGFSYEGTLRESAKHNGKLHDMEVYSVLRRERSDAPR